MLCGTTDSLLQQPPERTFDIWLKSANPPPLLPKELLPKGSTVPNTSVTRVHWNAFGTFMERARNYNKVKPQTTLSKSSRHLACSERACVLFSERGMWHDCLIFRDILQKTWKAEALLNLTYASDQLIKGVSWRSVNLNCARVVLKLSGMPLNEKKITANCRWLQWKNKTL